MRGRRSRSRSRRGRFSHGKRRGKRLKSYGVSRGGIRL